MVGPTGPSIARMQRPTMRPRKKNAAAAQTGLALQQQVGAIPQGAPPPTPAAAGQIGTAITQQAGATAVQGAQQQAQQNAAAGQQAVQGQQMQAGADIAARKNSLAQRAIEQGQKIARLSSESQNKISEERNEFARDRQGQTYLNERQLADWQLKKAQSVRDYEKWAQAAKQEHDKKLSLLDLAHKKISQALEAEYLKDRQSKDHRLATQLAHKRAEIEKQIADEQAASANRQGMWQAGGAVVGGVIGILGGPPGVVAGATIGSGVGSMIGGATA